MMEPKIIKAMNKLCAKMGIDIANITRVIHILPGVQITDRWVEVMYVKGEEIGVLEISSPIVDIYPVGYREKTYQYK